MTTHNPPEHPASGNTQRDRRKARNQIVSNPPPDAFLHSEASFAHLGARISFHQLLWVTHKRLSVPPGYQNPRDPLPPHTKTNCTAGSHLRTRALFLDQIDHWHRRRGYPHQQFEVRLQSDHSHARDWLHRFSFCKRCSPNQDTDETRLEGRRYPFQGSNTHRLRRPKPDHQEFAELAQPRVGREADSAFLLSHPTMPYPTRQQRLNARHDHLASRFASSHPKPSGDQENPHCRSDRQDWLQANEESIGLLKFLTRCIDRWN